MDKTQNRHLNEILTDNTQFDFYAQCKNCALWGNDPQNYASNAYNKGSCDAYPFPACKPWKIQNNEMDCEHKKPR